VSLLITSGREDRLSAAKIVATPRRMNSMATYLLLWNPRKWAARKIVGDIFESRAGKLFASWSSGRNKSIVPGDRLFLAHVGAEPRGIIASGVALSSPEPGKHWNPILARAKRKALFVRGRFDVALDPRVDRILTFEELVRAGLEFNWSQRASGVEVPGTIAQRLEQIWMRRTGVRELLPVIEPTALEGLRTETVTYVRGRSRRLHDEALRAARGICEGCSRDFTRVLQGRGVRVLQVHHRRQLAANDTPVVSRLRDLAVLCANCHMLVHMNSKRAIRVEKLRELLKQWPGA
jgi:hypothetical protein